MFNEEKSHTGSEWMEIKLGRKCYSFIQFMRRQAWFPIILSSSTRMLKTQININYTCNVHPLLFTTTKMPPASAENHEREKEKKERILSILISGLISSSFPGGNDCYGHHRAMTERLSVLPPMFKQALETSKL